MSQWKEMKAVKKNDEVNTIDIPMDSKASDTSIISIDGDEVSQTSQVLIKSKGHVQFQVHSTMYYLLHNTKELHEMKV